jgi:hypothetical protein
MLKSRTSHYCLAVSLSCDGGEASTATRGGTAFLLVGGGAEVEGGEDAGPLTADEAGSALEFFVSVEGDEEGRGRAYCVGTGAAVIVVLG